ncbi:pilus assembly protein [Rhizobium cauense]|uniref:TadE/TadG family type IV pilus assembly protein n=1 Tax=Rhizobium cauense TaxID=1166683 RepID=UPI001C6F30F9|nr:TadE/TadG family type IV pilus assembly protein [Rhizobium cauense]MBW9112492.1 pilus assembly protein [Rhizobium cauense]
MAGRGVLIRLHRLSKRFIGDRQGVGAIEFAILFPILVMLYIGAFEITIGLSISKRASRAAGTITDIVTQQKSVTKSWLADMPSVANAVFVPYGSTDLTVKVTGIALDGTATPKVAWSWAQDGSRPYAVNSAATVPTEMRKANTFLVRTELSIPYKLFLFAPNLVPNNSTITISRSYFYLPRASDTVTCGDC